MMTQRAHRIQRYINPRQRGWDPYDNTHPLMRWYFYRRLDIALRLADVQHHHCVVDIGCWMGHLAVSLVRDARIVIGVDRADEICREPYFDARVAGWNCLQIAQEMVEVETGHAVTQYLFARGDVTSLPIESGSVDIVFCLDTLEHVADLQGALTEIKRIMCPGGALIVAAPIELGAALVLRQIAGALTGFFREPYSIRQLFKTLFTNSVPIERKRGGLHHMGYDWRQDHTAIDQLFCIEQTVFVPISPLGPVNPTVMLRARKIS